MKKKKYLPLYFEWTKHGRIFNRIDANTDGGLCSTEIGNKNHLLELFNGREFCHHSYWGYEYELNGDLFAAAYGFTPLRQNIVLFMAAMNNEL